MFRFKVGDRVRYGGLLGVVRGLVKYPDGRDPSLEREEYQVQLDAAGGSGATTSFRESDIEEGD